MSTRYFEFSDGMSNKYWEIETKTWSGKHYTMDVRYGKIGSKGQESRKEFDGLEKMHKQAEKLIAEKVGKGYLEKDMLARALASLPAVSESVALFEEARRLMRNLQGLIEREYPKNQDRFEMDMLPALLADAQRGGLAWQFLVDDVHFKEVDRRKSMLKGPFFITEKYPVPRKRNGEYMIPIIQADLRELSKLRGLPLGDGLLQAWWTLDEWECRVIPRQVVDKQESQPFPMDINAFDEDGKCFIENWMSAEQFGRPVEDDERLVPMILGYRDPFFCIRANIEDATWEGFVAERIGGMETEVSRDEELDATVIEFKNRLEDDDYQGDELVNHPEPAEYTRLIEVLKKLEADHPSCDHAFGSFHGIHDRPHEVQEDTLFAFESEYFSFGGAGNAHVLYGFKDGQPYFEFTWANCR